MASDRPLGVSDHDGPPPSLRGLTTFDALSLLLAAEGLRNEDFEFHRGGNHTEGEDDEAARDREAASSEAPAIEVAVEDCLALVESVARGERRAVEVRSIASDSVLIHPLFLRRAALAAGAVAVVFLLTRRRRNAR